MPCSFMFIISYILPPSANVHALVLMLAIFSCPYAHSSHWPTSLSSTVFECSCACCDVGDSSMPRAFMVAGSQKHRSNLSVNKVAWSRELFQIGGKRCPISNFVIDWFWDHATLLFTVPLPPRFRRNFWMFRADSLLSLIHCSSHLPHFFLL